MKNTDIAEEFERFYSTLYNTDNSNPSASSPTTRANKIKMFLDQYSPRISSQESADSLEGPITQLEWTTALKQLKSGKSPGPDGLSAVYYKTFVEILGFPFRRAGERNRQGVLLCSMSWL